ncbi:MAG: preprotein translocase subunit YajC [Treponema sp.]|jgi:preprotein translocase subunit YajC|nr:preprotein translocase subunit YajC [Treponema sp.]
MFSFVLPLLMGVPASGGEGGGSASFLTSLLPFAAIIAIFYFLIIRPQNKKQKETQRMLGALKKGDRVVTIGGVHGTIQSVKEKTVIVRVDESVKLEFSRSAVSSVERVEKVEKEEKKESGDDAAEAEDKKDSDAGE